MRVRRTVLSGRMETVAFRSRKPSSDGLVCRLHHQCARQRISRTHRIIKDNQQQKFKLSEAALRQESLLHGGQDEDAEEKLLPSGHTVHQQLNTTLDILIFTLHSGWLSSHYYY